jgi:Cysteine rich repeat
MKKTLVMIGFCLIGAARAVVADETPPAAPPVSAEMRAACEADVAKLCAGVQPGGGRIMQCLAQHKGDVSDGCKQAIMKARQGKK